MFNIFNFKEEKVVEVYTDKLVAEIPSPSKGKINKLNYKVEESCLVIK
jgi:pyruvate/2-oxoglutarate dehydrogenase complex dihydrolipoamide acyltransferase (E2) component